MGTPIAIPNVYFKKMSLLYQGKENAESSCIIILPGMSKFPTVSYTEVVDPPIRNIDLSLATDTETPSIVIGNGIWENCWIKVGVNDKAECYQKSLDRGSWGFAFSDDETPNICL